MTISNTQRRRSVNPRSRFTNTGESLSQSSFNGLSLSLAQFLSCSTWASQTLTYSGLGNVVIDDRKQQQENQAIASLMPRYPPRNTCGRQDPRGQVAIGQNNKASSVHSKLGVCLDCSATAFHTADAAWFELNAGPIFGKRK